MEIVMKYLPLLIPIVVLELALTIVALVHMLKHKKFKFGNLTLWVILAFVQIVGPILYFTIGKADDDE
ncbi:MAG: PLDc N-terminal domain-containing protein [Anaerolineae bacterium]|nr:PLDc N-terminal domain-containing protein [Anaerolineae bacterium]